jgi:rhodanese-related sulfurtransferase
LAAFGLAVKEMVGGIEGWQAEDLPVERAAISV